jgi:hypothetical protein
MSDETATIIRLEQELREAKERLALDPQHQIGEVFAVLARIERRLETIGKDVDTGWRRSGEALDQARQAREATQHVGTLVVEQHEQTRRAIAALPCNVGPKGNGGCPCSDTERPPSLHAVEL